VIYFFRFSLSLALGEKQLAEKVRIQMKVLICCNKGPARRYLVSLLTDSLIKEVTGLVNDRKHSHAAAMAFSKGSFEREVTDDEFHTIEADLIISEHNIRWDLKD